MIYLCNIVAKANFIIYFWSVMLRFRQHIALFLALLMAPAILPREVWHHCDSGHVSTTDTGESLSGDCDLCSLPAPSFTETTSPVVFSVPGYCPVFEQPTGSYIPKDGYSNSIPRAPPVA